MIAIRTRWLGQTNTRPARIVAESDDFKYVVNIGTHAYTDDLGAHRAALDNFLKQRPMMPGTGWVHGWIDGACIWVHP